MGDADGSDAYIITSPDGITWTERANPKNLTLHGITWNGTIFCAVGDDDGADAYIITSPDGITWTERVNAQKLNLGSIAWNGTVFCAVGVSDAVDAYIITSPDGITWTERSNPLKYDFNGVTWNGVVFCAVGVSKGSEAAIQTSTDGITWVSRSNPSNVDLNAVVSQILQSEINEGVVTSAGIAVPLFIGVNAAGSTIFPADLSSVGVAADSLVGFELKGLVFCAVGFIDGVKPAYILISLDGVTWNRFGNPKSIQLNGIIYTDDFFCAVGDADGSDSYILKSTNGASWLEQSNPKNFALQDVAWDGTTLCAVGDADGGDAYLLTSTDGITWTERANPKNFTLHGITWNGTIFCAVGDGDGADAYIITSPDGITWTERANPKNFILREVTWNGTIFCAVGDGDGVDAYIITSPDGITWTERANPKNLPLFDVAWNDLLFCAVGATDSGDAYLITSADGITWAERANPKNVNLLSVVWRNNGFAAVGDKDGIDAYIVTSPDGITWTERVNTDNGILYAIEQGISTVLVSSADLVSASSVITFVEGAASTAFDNQLIDIYNLALQKLGAATLETVDEDSRNRRSCDNCYRILRDSELRAHPWTFSIKRVSLTASATIPLALTDTFYPNAAAFVLPTDYLRILFPPRTHIDWVIENIGPEKAIITNDAGPLTIRYISRVSDTTLFDDNFTEMLACKMAMFMAEQITQSNSKIANISAQYNEARKIARKMNAFEKIPFGGPEDSWITARREGTRSAPWLRRQNG